MLCPVCNKGQLRVYEFGEMSYTMDSDGDIWQDQFHPDEGNGAWTECDDCQASDSGNVYTGSPELEVKYKLNFQGIESVRRIE